MNTRAEHPSQISCVDLQKDREQRISALVGNFSFSAIYGRHLTEDDASQALDLIEDNSVVFTEGYLKERDYALRRILSYLNVADRRIIEGIPYSISDREVWNLAGEFFLRQYSPPTVHDPYSMALHEGLLAKGCAILPADYVNLDEDCPDLTALEELREEASSLFPPDSKEDIDRLIDLELQILNGDLENQAIRERFALDLILYFAERYSSAKSLGSLALGEGGKTRAYVIFGLAHRDSLTSLFENFGIQVKRHLINPYPDTPLDHSRNIGSETLMTQAERRDMIERYYKGRQ
jgi:hypothetical protein